jgi:hypothetical protein
MNWYGKRDNEIIGHWRCIEALLLTHPVLLKKSRWNDCNYTLKDHQTRS